MSIFIADNQVGIIDGRSGRFILSDFKLFPAQTRHI